MLRMSDLMRSLVMLTLASTISHAADLKIAARAEPVMDPHYAWSTANVQYYFQYLGFLIKQGVHDEALPGLAASFEPKSNNLWEFKLRPGLHFDNGAPLRAQDIAASYQRARMLPNAIGSYAGLFSGVKEITAVDDTTLQISTSKPIPTLPSALTQVAIVPQSIAETATQNDFISGKANVGAGQYKFVSFRPSESLVLSRNEKYWGEKARWDTVTFRFIPDDASRVAALLAGDVDAADGIPTGDVERIKKDGRFVVHDGPADRVVFLWLDTERDSTPDVLSYDGKPLDKNPLKDLKVRRALSLAIDREAIRQRVMNGQSFPTNQLVAPGVGGYADNIGPPRYDTVEAKRLMKEAGYDKGFQITLRCPQGRYVNDSRICQAIAQMLGRIGIKVSLVTEPFSVYLSRVTKHDGPRASLFMFSWSSASSGEADVLQNCLHTYDPVHKLGTWNLGHYSNPAVDKLIDAIQVTLDREKRWALQREAMKLAVDDVAVIPLHAQSVAVATRKDMDYTPYLSEATIANDIKPRGK